VSEYLQPRRVRHRFGLFRHEGDFLSESAIVEAAQPHSPASGVYFLIAGGKVQYIGQARDVDRRLADHWRDGRRWDAVTVVECDIKHLDVVESVYIHKLQPTLQGRQKCGALVAPIRECDVYQQCRPVRPNGLG
jgi:hypothetical protein